MHVAKTNRTTVPTIKQRLKTMKQMRSMTAAAIIHSLIISWFLSVWRRSSVSLCSLVSSRSRMSWSRSVVDVEPWSSSSYSANVVTPLLIAGGTWPLLWSPLWPLTYWNLGWTMGASDTGTVLRLLTRRNTARRPQMTVCTLTQHRRVGYSSC